MEAFKSLCRLEFMPSLLLCCVSLYGCTCPSFPGGEGGGGDPYKQRLPSEMYIYLTKWSLFRATPVSSKNALQSQQNQKQQNEIREIPNIEKLNNTLLNKLWFKEEIMRNIRKYFK